MKPTPQIRFATKADLASIVLLCAAHAAYEKADYAPEGKKEALEKHLFCQAPTLYCLVAELNGEVIGYATYLKQFETWGACFYLYMDCLYLSKSCRGLGIGRAIMQRIQAEAQQMGVQEIQWQTPEFNTGAIQFYHRLGAKSKAKERFFWK